MPIDFVCPCGKTLRVGDEYAGRRAKCPACGAVGYVKPQTEAKPAKQEEEEPQFEVVDDEPETPRPTKKSPPPDDDDDDEPRPKKKKRVRDYDDDDDDDDYEPRPRKKKRRRRRPPPPEYHDNYRGRGESDLTAIDWCLCILCPGIGCIVGLIRLISGSSEGAKMMGISLIFAVLWNVLRFALEGATGR